ncbi:GNAT family N-acetyltransferase [Lactobacillus psittaci]|uniref:N-acetyltransferase n=1 Tax=Lactobacillus psittaci DSM 15354 TaxID=1122152 RepID=A0A0R1S8H9_9LACO|nr:GNAT family N-acetyltransferase [Lactobacillus psittaci]KRL61803.1 N-acetyltransferase [Lactobacillus psittaci DSM 15354]
MRHVLAKDATLLYKWSQNPIYAERANFTSYKDLNAAKRGAELLERRKYSFIICLNNDKAVGLIELYSRGVSQSLQNTKEIGFLLDQEYWHQGLMTEACKALIDYAFTNLNQTEIWAGVKPDNVASRNLIERLGFKYKYQVAYPCLLNQEPLVENYYLLVNQ